MANNERPNLKQIRIKTSVCERLYERKQTDDSYTDVIKRLLDDNERLKARCDELEKDKELIARLVSATSDEVKRTTNKNSENELLKEYLNR